jgi:threonine 3-dehydrogenase
MRAVRKARPERGMDFDTDAPVPEIAEHEVLVEVAATSICGVDRHVFDWDAAGRTFVKNLPVIPGHETAGVVRKVGGSVTSVAVGDRVALESHIVCNSCFECRTGNAHLCSNQQILGLSCDGAFAEFVKVPGWSCYVIPDNVSFENAALFEPAGVAVHAIQRSDSLTGQTVAVSGCGPIGLFLVQLAQLAGASRVIGVETNPYRRRLAEKYGAVTVDPRSTDVVAEAKKITGRRHGVDTVFEASGVAPALLSALEMLRPAGTVITVGHPGEVTIDVSRLVNINYLTLRGVFGRRLWDTWETLGELVGSGRFELDSLISHQLGIDEFARAIDLLGGDAGKIILVPGRS